MKTSFIVIAYNEARGIADTLRSIVAQTGLQSYEVIVVDDGSTDATRAIAERLSDTYPAIRVIHQHNQGRGAARDTGVRAATGDYLAFIDADIVLPPDWYQRCKAAMQQYDAVGGIAVPDGDATFIYRVCKLQPKVAAQTTTITGNNGFFRRAVFDKVSYNPTKKNGEDVALGFAMEAAGIGTSTLSDLIVDHREHKTFRTSISWLFESGIGASRQWYEHPALRIPDLAFFGFVGLVAGTVTALFTTGWWPVFVVALLAYITFGSFMHLQGKFVLGQTPLRSLRAIVLNSSLITAYYIGRLVGHSTEWKKRGI